MQNRCAEAQANSSLALLFSSLTNAVKQREGNCVGSYLPSAYAERMILARLRSDPEVGAKERSAKLRLPASDDLPLPLPLGSASGLVLVAGAELVLG